jgi:threonine 3-dehydrogenase
VSRDGAFAEYVALPASNVWVHRTKVPLDVAAIFDAFGNAVHTALSFPLVGEDVLITGAGPIGIMATAVARHAGARNVVITDISEPRLELARKVGATLALNVAETGIAEAQRRLRLREGFDIGLEMSGRPEAVREMVANMTHGGRIAMLGLPAEEFPVDWSKIVTSMITIKGIYGREMYETWYAMTVLIEGGLDLTPVITGHYAYHDFESAFDEAAAARGGKIILDWTA